MRDPPMARWGMKYTCLRERKVRESLFHCLRSVFGPMLGTVIFMERFIDSLSKPVA
jgi:hypothetical protein